MMSCTASAVWSRPISSPCYTEHGQRCGAVLSGRITTVAMSRSGQLDLCCTVELNCSGLSVCLAGALVTCDRALDTCQQRPPLKLKTSMAGSPSKLKTSMAGPLGGAVGRSGSGHHRS
jgi:hypothetical protein